MCECKNESQENIKHTAHARADGERQNPRRRGEARSRSMGFWSTSCLTVFAIAIIVAWIPNLLSPEPPKGNVGGFVDARFKKVEDLFRLHLLSCEEKGAAFAVFKDGKPVVDLWGGYADIQAWQPWKSSTLSNTFSLFNAVVTLSLGLLYERGHVDYDLPVSRYWPEFSAHGKQTITVRELLAGQAGLGRLQPPVSLARIENSDEIANILANQTAQPSGSLLRHQNQAVLELYADQLVRRTDPQHRSLREFFQQEISGPFDIEYYIGLPLPEQYRAARLRGHGFSIVFEVLFAPIELFCTLLSYMKASTFIEINSMMRLNDPEVRLSSVGTISGFSSARALAQLYRDLVLIDDMSFNRVISSSTWDNMTRDYPPTGLNYLATRLGVITDYTESAAGLVRLSPKGTKMVGFSAFGGQYVYVDREKSISLAYLTNYNSIYSLEHDPRFKSLLRAVYDSV